MGNKSSQPLPVIKMPEIKIPEIKMPVIPSPQDIINGIGNTFDGAVKDIGNTVGGIEKDIGNTVDGAVKGIGDTFDCPKKYKELLLKHSILGKDYTDISNKLINCENNHTNISNKLINCENNHTKASENLNKIKKTINLTRNKIKKKINLKKNKIKKKINELSNESFINYKILEHITDPGDEIVNDVTELTDVIDSNIKNVIKINKEVENIQSKINNIDNDKIELKSKNITRARMIQIMQENNIYKQKVIYSLISLIFFILILIIFINYFIKKK